MPETKSRFLKDIIEKNGPDAEAEPSFTKERQHTAQAFNLHVERRDGRRAEGFAWSHYVGYDWRDDGEREKLTVVFGERAIEIEGHNLGVLINEIREGQLNSIRELASRQATLFEHSNPENHPIISSVRSYPDFDKILSDIKGEDDGKPQYVRRVAGR